MKIWDVLHEEALKGRCIRGSKHASAIVYKKKIISVGTNRLKTHPVMKKYGKNEHCVFLHAEIDAIVKAINKIGTELLSECDIYIIRLTKGNKIGGSKPCSGCQKAIEDFSIRNVYFS